MQNVEEVLWIILAACIKISDGLKKVLLSNNEPELDDLGNS